METTTGKTTQQFMFSLIEIWKSSGKTQRQFCKEKDLACHKFHYWFRKYNFEDTPPEARPACPSGRRAGLCPDDAAANPEAGRENCCLTRCSLPDGYGITNTKNLVRDFFKIRCITDSEISMFDPVANKWKEFTLINSNEKDCLNILLDFLLR
jgi:hypothetical protein